MTDRFVTNYVMSGVIVNHFPDVIYNREDDEDDERHRDNNKTY